MVLGTAAVVSGCAAEGDGLVIRFEGADTAATGGTVATLELFVGRTGQDPRFARDHDPMRDLFEVDAEALVDYRLFLRAAVVPTDLEVVAIVGYDADPAQGGRPLIFGVIEDPPFVPGQLTEIPMTFDTVVARGNAGTGARWIDRWGADPLEAVADHACLAWGTGGAAAADGEIVRVDDLDCDGTLPPTCDPMQLDRRLLEGEADLDGDGYGEWATATCDACLVQDSDNAPLYPVRCDCDETDPTVSFGALEICDGLDTNCDGAIDGDYAGPDAIPCQLPNVGVDCTMGVRTCTESNGLMEGACVAVPAGHVACFDLGACAAPRQCPIGDVAQPATLDVYHCTQNVGDGTICGVAPVRQFFATLPVVNPPARCSATVWNGNRDGWKVLITDTVTGDKGLTIRNVPCDQLAVVVDEVPTTAVHLLAIVVIADGLTGTPIGVVPIDYGVADSDEPCASDDVTTCIPPIAGS